MDKEQERIIDQFDSVKLTRRQALKWLGVSLVSSAIFAADTGILINNAAKARGIDADLEKIYPRPPQNEEELNNYKSLQEKIVALAQDGKWDEINKVVASDEFIKANTSSIQQEAYQKAKVRVKDKLLKKNGLLADSESSELAILALLPLEPTALFSTVFYLSKRKKFKEAKENAIKRLSFYEKLLNGKKSGKEIIAFDRKLHYLAPLGGKIYSVNKNGYSDNLNPTISAEEQLENVKDLRRNGKLTEHYIHQLTVQGKLPDQFKFAAIALILHSPFLYDWNKPFFEAEWGKIGPLIHDGGNVDTKLNPLWKKVKGRTDFLQRVSINNVTELGTLEKMTPEQLIKEPVDKLEQARKDELEEKRIDLEGKFYQRAASSLHARIGTMPNKIPENMRKKLVLVWEKFEFNIRLLLSEYDLDGVGNVAWFLDKPTNRGALSGYGKRYEADWEPIKQELIKFEQVRQQHREIKPKVNQILRETVESVDRIIGLN